MEKKAILSKTKKEVPHMEQRTTMSKIKEELERMGKKKKMIPILDIHVAAFLEYKDCPAALTRQDSRVVFELPETERTCELLRMYHLNPMVPVLSYVTILRKLRAQLTTLKREEVK